MNLFYHFYVKMGLYVLVAQVDTASATDAMGANAAVFSISTFPIKKLSIKSNSPNMFQYMNSHSDTILL